MKLSRIKPQLPARVGLYSSGLLAYWDQFPGLRQRLDKYNCFIEEKLSPIAEVHNFGMVDTEGKAREAGEYFNSKCVDIVLCHIATYCTSACVLPIHQLNHAPVVVLNLQPAAEMDYTHTDTGEWLAQCVGCPVPEISNAFERTGISFRSVTGLLGLKTSPAGSLADERTSERPEAIRAWHEIKEWIQAAAVKRNLSRSRFGFLGGYYSGMLDMYSDLTQLQGQTGIHVEILEMCDLAKLVGEVSEREIEEKRKQITDFFEISGDSPSDSIACRPTEEQLEWSCRVAAAQEKLVCAFELDALAYYYHGGDNEYGLIQSGFIVGHSLLTAQGVPCSGEGDVKTALAMKICDMLDAGGSFCEIVAADFNRNTMILGHDGPFHISISNQKPILRGMAVYHGKKGSGVSVEAKIIPGDITTLSVTQTGDGRLRMIASEGTAIDAPILMNGNTMTHVEFSRPPVEYMDHWFAQAPTHHCALSIGHCAKLYRKVADLLAIHFVEV